MLIQTKRRDIIWNYLGIFFSMALQVIWLPVLIYYLPPDILGIWYVFLSIGAVVQLFDLGFNPTISHCVTYAWSGAIDLKKIGVIFTEGNREPNYALMAGLWNACRYLYFGIAFAAAAAMALGGTAYLKHIAFKYYSSELFCAWGIYIASVFANLYIGYYTVILRGIGDVSRANKANVIAKGAFLICGTAGLALGQGLVSLSVSYFLSGFILRSLCKRYLLREHKFSEILKDYKSQTIYSKGHLLKTMWFNAWRDGLVTLTSFLNGQATVLLCSNFLSLYETGIYSFSIQVINAITAIANALMGAYSPAMQSAYVTKNKSMAKDLYGKAMAGFYLVCLCGFMGFLLIGIPIISFLRKDFVINPEYFAIMALANFLFVRHRDSAWFISTMNKLPYTFSFTIFGILSITCTFIGLYFFNLQIWGLILIPFVCQAAFNNWYWNFAVNKYLGTNEFKLISSGLLQLKSKAYICIAKKLTKSKEKRL